MGSLRELLHIFSSCIDDIFMSGDSELDCIQALVDTINLLLGLGFTLHPDKCQFIPSTKVKTLGFIIDSVSMKVTLMDDIFEMHCWFETDQNKKISQADWKTCNSLPSIHVWSIIFPKFRER